MDNHSIDIIVPTFRLDEALLTGIINLPKPVGFSVYIYIISDNPKAAVPESLNELNKAGKIKLLINSKNLGPSATRNAGIRAGNSKWILLLDDDIKPEANLLPAYADAISKNEQAIGFAGVTYFPKPFNAVTTALEISGYVWQFKAALEHEKIPWVPTANMMLNREKMDAGLFDEALTKSGEDIDFLVRNSLLNKEKYTGVIQAIAFHPWWNNGAMQTERMLRYGAGVSEIARKEPIKQYTFYDFTNTSETTLLLAILSVPAFFTGHLYLIIAFLIMLLFAEFITNWLKVIIKGKTYSPAVAFHLMWSKNCYELGFLYTSLTSGHIKGFAQRIDMGFNKPHPGSFRTNRWKIIKMILLTVLFLVAVITF